MELRIARSKLKDRVTTSVRGNILVGKDVIILHDLESGKNSVHVIINKSFNFFKHLFISLTSYGKSAAQDLERLSRYLEEPVENLEFLTEEEYLILYGKF